MLNNCFNVCGYAFKDEYEEVKDVFEIYKRIKEVNPAFVLLFNRKQKRFEVHNVVQPVSSLVCVWNKPIDERLVEYLQKTKRENFDTLMKSIENDNLQIYAQKNQKILEFAQNFTKEAVFLAEHKRADLSKTDFDLIRKSLKGEN